MKYISIIFSKNEVANEAMFVCQQNILKLLIVIFNQKFAKTYIILALNFHEVFPNWNQNLPPLGALTELISCANGLKFKTVAVTAYGTLLSLT